MKIKSYVKDFMKYFPSAFHLPYRLGYIRIHMTFLTFWTKETFPYHYFEFCIVCSILKCISGVFQCLYHMKESLILISKLFQFIIFFTEKSFFRKIPFDPFWCDSRGFDPRRHGRQQSCSSYSKFQQPNKEVFE